MQHGGGGGVRRGQIAQGGTEQQGPQHGGGNAPVDHFLLQQEETTQQVAQVDPAPANPAPALEHGVSHHLAGGEPLGQARLQGVEGGGHGQAIHPLLELRQAVTVQAEAGEDHRDGVPKVDPVGGDAGGGQPAGHLDREGDQQQHIGHHGRVEQVLTEPAIEVLGDDDGKGGAEYQHPPGQQGGQGEADQHGGESRAAVQQGRFDGAAAQAQDQGLAAERRHQGQQGLDQGSPAEEPGLGQEAG
ncbi:hypothetical protein D3C78_961100 [compost metagenome]